MAGCIRRDIRLKGTSVKVQMKLQANDWHQQPFSFSVHYADSKAKVCSLDDSGRLLGFTFINKSPTPLALFWLDFKGTAKHFGNIPGGAQTK